MGGYQTLLEIVLDPKLDLDLDRDATVEQALAAVESRLRANQWQQRADGDDRPSLLVAARKVLKEIEAGGSTTELVRVPSETLVKMVTALESRAEKDAQRAERAERIANEERITRRRIAATTKATSDFRSARSLPLGITALAGIVGAIWATRQIVANGAIFSISRTVWLVCAIAAFVLAIMGLLIAYRNQRRDEVVLKRLYDADVQGDALRRLLQTSDTFGRSEFRSALWVFANRSAYMAHIPDELNYPHPDDPDWLPRERSFWVGRSRRLSKVDLDSAVRDAGDLAISRFVDMEILVAVTEGGRDIFLSAP